jgi:hypothetical protein
MASTGASTEASTDMPYFTVLIFLTYKDIFSYIPVAKKKIFINNTASTIPHPELNGWIL